jgi:hypothetical protein
VPAADNGEATGGLPEAADRFWRVGRVLLPTFLAQARKVDRPPGRNPARVVVVLTDVAAMGPKENPGHCSATPLAKSATAIESSKENIALEKNPRSSMQKRRSYLIPQHRFAEQLRASYAPEFHQQNESTMTQPQTKTKRSTDPLREYAH